MTIAESGFCDHELNFVTDSPDRGKYNWNETEVGKENTQICDYGTVSEDSGNARRNCIAHSQWGLYDGSECITFATLQLRLISQVGIT